MHETQNDFTIEHYAPRARDYVESAVHSAGQDLDQMEALLDGRGLGRALDLGCGGGHVSYRAAPHVGAVVACDVTQAMLDAVARTAAERGLSNVSTSRASAERLPFDDASFDIVLCRFTTHHWPDMEAGLREARRVLKADAPAVFIDSVAPPPPPLDSHLQTVELLRDASHGRNYTTLEWLAALSRARFAVESVTARKLRMDFPVWIARTRTPPAHAAAIRSLQASASEAVKRHFAIGEDGSFDLDVVTMVVRAA